MLPHPPIPTLFPYTTLFRSSQPSNGRRYRLDAVDHINVQPSDETCSPNRASRILAGPTASEAERRSRSEEHTSELQSLRHLVCRLLLEKKNWNVRFKPQVMP